MTATAINLKLRIEMKRTLTTDEIIERHGLTVSAHLGNWHISAPRLTPTSVMHPNRSAAVDHFCRLHKLETETQVVPIPDTIEQLIERHKITVSFLGGGNWRADVGRAVGDGLKSAYGNTAAGAVNELVAEIESRSRRASALGKGIADYCRNLAHAGAGFFEGGGYVGNHGSGLPQSEWGEAKAPPKKPAEIIAEAKAEAEKSIKAHTLAVSDAFYAKTGLYVDAIEGGVKRRRQTGAPAAPYHEVDVTITTS